MIVFALSLRQFLDLSFPLVEVSFRCLTRKALFHRNGLRQIRL